MGVEMARTMMSFRLPDEVIEQLKKIARCYDVSMSDVINVLIRCRYAEMYGYNIGDFVEVLDLVK